MFTRYASRNVVYLSGGRDVTALGNETCHKDEYQGPNRRERSERYYQSLQVLGKEMWDAQCNGILEERGEMSSIRGADITRQYCAQYSAVNQVHDRVVVRNVGHDHALIFQSAEGLEEVFGWTTAA